ncbi:hypothetical protein Dsin_009347 [Dipteronia sinensis]|uniref:TF-B3 domain-containing protein n=1 Tax=Dipteronia sinensis TaxID=43782 RepID=A0AAE0EC08_9ROSI|nr:hypothetical protein Dsin_009347 [Dipteronia sinensis]
MVKNLKEPNFFFIKKMDLEVKQEVAEEQPNTASYPEQQVSEPGRDREVTLAELSTFPASKPKRRRRRNYSKILNDSRTYSLSGNEQEHQNVQDEQVNATNNREKIILKIRKSQSESTPKLALSTSGEKSKSCKKNKPAIDGKCSPEEVDSPAMIRAKEVQSNLDPMLPNFAKPMVRSHVASCFWMGLPGQFCKSHLPNKDATVTLEDECGEQYEAKYFAEKTGLSAGWRQFSTAHNLLEGDVLVFQLVGPLKFKVYIIKANDLTELDGALGLLNLDSHTKQNGAVASEENNEEMGIPTQNTKRKRHKSLPLAVVQKRNKRSGQPRSASNLGQPAEQSENDSEEVGSEVLEGYKLSAPVVQFKDVTSLDNFNILVDGMVIDSELPENMRIKYYNLCCSQNAFLHENIIQGINFKLIVGTISETVNIADALRNCNLSTSRDEFSTWDKSLKAFELLGMNVGFLRARLYRLLKLAFESEGATEIRRYIEAKAQKAQAEEEIRSIQTRLMELKGDCVRFSAEVESLKSKTEGYNRKFKEEVNTPW